MDFNSLCEILGLPQADLPFSNQSAHRPYVDCYDAEIERHIDQLYEKDADHFGYHFGDTLNRSEAETIE
ncbi:MAG: hypothetical protein JWN70_4698 [Planctomycetaceae bacterium]|nr:hypothetical protein [Planctomycetaceae bacterium]